MSEVKAFSPLSEIIGADATKYDTVEAYGKVVRIGSMCSADMIDWIESQTDPERRKFAGIRLLVMSLVGPNGERIPKEERDATVEVFKQKDASSNRVVIKKARLLNGLDEIGKVLTDALKNDSGGASSDASPSASPSPSVV
jgi:hypothetical protein